MPKEMKRLKGVEGYKAKAYRTLLQSLASFEAANNNEMREKAKSRQHRERIRKIKKEDGTSTLA